MIVEGYLKSSLPIAKSFQVIRSSNLELIKSNFVLLFHLNKPSFSVRKRHHDRVLYAYKRQCAECLTYRVPIVYQVRRISSTQLSSSVVCLSWWWVVYAMNCARNARLSDTITAHYWAVPCSVCCHASVNIILRIFS